MREAFITILLLMGVTFVLLAYLFLVDEDDEDE